MFCADAMFLRKCKKVLATFLLVIIVTSLICQLYHFNFDQQPEAPISRESAIRREAEPRFQRRVTVQNTPMESVGGCKTMLCLELLSEFDRAQYDKCTEAVLEITVSPVKAQGKCHFMNGTNRAPVALASFEGSGNTWVRGLLEQATGICTGSSFPKNPHCDVSLRNGGFNGESVKSGAVIAVKTHLKDLSWTNASETQYRKDGHPLYGAAILIIRNPLDALVAEWNRKGSIAGQNDPHTASVPQSYFLTNVSWNSYVQKRIVVWKWFLSSIVLNKYHMPVLVVKYEDLRSNPLQQMKRILNFLKIPFSSEELEKRLATDFLNFYRGNHMNHSTFEHYTDEQLQLVAGIVEDTIQMLEKGKADLNISEYRVSEA